jgi:metal-responsive CopG/Arc/MetJ family transcriptional regulator
MPADPNKFLVTMPPDLRAELDRISEERAAESRGTANRSDTVRWLLLEHLKREKKSRKKSDQPA